MAEQIADDPALRRMGLFVRNQYLAVPSQSIAPFQRALKNRGYGPHE
jgi:hypothetical protein